MKNRAGRQAHKNKVTRRKNNGHPRPSFLPTKRKDYHYYSRIPKRCLLSFSTGVKLLVFFAIVLCMGFAGIAGVPARVPTCSVGEEMSGNVVVVLVPARVSSRSVVGEVCFPRFETTPAVKKPSAVVRPVSQSG